MTTTLSATQRIQLMNILPSEAGSLRESIQIKRLRDRLGLSDEEQEAIEIGDNGSFNPAKLAQLDDTEFNFSSGEEKIIGASFVAKEDEGEVPTSNAFVDLAIEFKDAIEAFRDEVNDHED